MRVSKKAVKVVPWAAASIAILWVWQRRSISQSKIEFGATDSQQEPAQVADSDECASTNEVRRTEERSPGKESPDSKDKFGWRFLPWLSIAASLALSIISISAVYVQGLLLAGVCLLVGMALCAYFLRGPRRRYKRRFTVTFGILLYIQIIVSLILVINEETNTSDAISLLAITIFCICSLSILVCLGATWLRTMRFTEPIAVGIVAVAVGLLCFPGLRLASEQLTPPFFTGSALLFATGRANQQISLFAGVIGVQDLIGSQSMPGSELLQVNNLSKHPVRWALLVTGEARIHKYTISAPGVAHVRLTASGSGLSSPSDTVAAQLFWGNLNGDRNVALNGTADGTFYDSTADRAAITLPYYGEGQLADLSAATKTTVVNALQASPVFRGKSDFTTQITSGPMYPLDSVTRGKLESSARSKHPRYPRMEGALCRIDRLYN